jgi:glycosyltransferase involved in cell wall biosynthesis
MLLVSSLEVGGAERQVVELARCLDPARFDLLICSLGTEVPLAESLPDLERRLVIVPKRGRFDATTVPRVARAMSRARVQIVQSFLFDADLVARCAARLAGAPVVIGSERNSDYRRPALQRLCLWLTRPWVDAVIANSEAGRRFTIRTLGMAEADVYAVPNGVDPERFRPRDPALARTALGLPTRGLVVGMVASFKPQKNHLMFLEVAGRVSARFPDAIFVCAGEPLSKPAGGPRWLRAGTGLHRDVVGYHEGVARAIEERGLADRCRLLGRVAAVEQVYNACDVTLLTSLHEGTPNALLESMASGVPVVATAVADNAELVPDGRVGHVVPPGDAAAMAARVEELLGDEGRRHALGAAARKWAEREFSSAALAARTATVYEELLRRKSRRSMRDAALPPSGRGGLARDARGRTEDTPARSRSGNSRV